MEPISEALDLLQGDKYMCMGFLLPTINWLKDKLLQLSVSGGSCKVLAAACLNGVNTRFESMINEKSIILSAVTHPKFKLRYLY